MADDVRAPRPLAGIGARCTRTPVNGAKARSRGVGAAAAIAAAAAAVAVATAAATAATV